MAVACLYGDDVYIQDVVFNSGDKTVTRPLVIGTLKKHHPHMVRWESNNGGDEYGGMGYNTRDYAEFSTVSDADGHDSISDQCPLGKALMGKHAGQNVRYSIDSTLFRYKILNVKTIEP